MLLYLIPVFILGGLVLLLGIVALLARIKGGRYLRPIMQFLMKVPLLNRGMKKMSEAALERADPDLASAVKKLERLGANRDPQFGPAVLFGLGGVFVEVLHDVALRVAPLRARDAAAMLDEIKGRALLDGARGQPAVSRAAIVDALCRLSDLMLAAPQIASVDLNPVLAYPDGLLAVDARIVLTQ